MQRFRIEHCTVYSYASAVSFGPHRLLLRPGGGHDLRVLDATIATSPASTIRWSEDALGNVLAHATFRHRASELRIESTLEVEHHGVGAPLVLPATPGSFPVAYDPAEHADLARTIERHCLDPQRRVDAWARRFVSPVSRPIDVISAMVAAIHGEMRYEPREAEGTQPPTVTLDRGAGACRDFAQLLIEACRSLGLAARFASGYLYDPTRDGPSPPETGGATHAWAQIYLPGAGWIECDPTHGKVGNEHLIRVGVARDATALAPVSGTWIGFPGDAVGMRVRVHVRKLDPVDLERTGTDARADRSGTMRLDESRGRSSAA